MKSLIAASSALSDVVSVPPAELRQGLSFIPSLVLGALILVASLFEEPARALSEPDQGERAPLLSCRFHRRLNRLEIPRVLTCFLSPDGG
jgi:hypothetical protein